MFKFVTLCALLAVATATPGLLAPLSYSANVIAPAPAVYASNPGLVYSPPVVTSAPLALSTPYGFSHFIKKRSAPLAFNSYIAPSTYVASAPLANIYGGPLAASYAAPLAATYSSPLYAAAHLIKKRSAAFIPSTYIAPTNYAATPVISTYAASGPVISTPYISTAPIAYGPHFIKKRSAPLAVAAYSAPASFSHQSRFDFQATSPAITTYSSYASPVIYPSLGVSRLI